MSEITEDINKLKEDEIDLIEVFRKIWDGRKIIYICVGISFVVGLIISLVSPKEYKSEVTLLVETGSGSGAMTGLLQQFGGLAGINLGAGSGEDALTPELYPSIIKSTPFLLGVMGQKVTETKYDSTLRVEEFLSRHTRSGIGSIFLGYTIGLPGKIIGWIKGKPKQVEMNNVISNKIPFKLSPEQSGIAGTLAERIKAKPGESASTLIISVEMQDPVVAAQLVDSVVKSLTGYIIEYRTQKAKVDLKFVQDRHDEAEHKYIKAQRTLAAFKDQNKNIILASALTTEQNLQAEYSLAFNVYNTLSQQLEQAKMKVQEKTPVFKVMDPAKVPLQKSKPRTSLILLGMVFCGGLVGITAAFGRLFLKKFN